MKSNYHVRHPGKALTGSALLIIALSLVLIPFPAEFANTQESDAGQAAAAFQNAYKVYMHPRCMNCHPSGDRPLQGDDNHVHSMNVVRGPEGMGKDGLLCSACHMDHNQPGDHMPPGAPGWQMPTADMPMVFQGKGPRELCEQFKDPARNGSRSPDEILDHVRDAPIVLWGWNPGQGRTPVSIMTHKEFVNYMSEWIKKGATCPK